MNLEQIYEFLNKTQDGVPVPKALEAVIKAKDECIKAKNSTNNNAIHDARGWHRREVLAPYNPVADT